MATPMQDQSTERTLGQLVADATADLSAIMRSEIQLAKAEIQQDAKNAGVGAGMFAGAGVLGFLALILLLIAAAYGLVAAGVWPWLAFLIVAVVLLIGAAVLALVGKGKVSAVKGKPERAIAEAQQTLQAIKPGS
ncbi:MAG TPA: phage holin family protein [Dermatophilaceae bacterium]|nr:phage holin family protein [Dermatophilaceae bacterium]